MKKILGIVIIAGIVAGTIFYHLVLLLSKGSFTIDSKFLFGAFAIMVLWCLIYMVINNFKLNKAVDRLEKTDEDMKQILKTIVENQLQNEINMEKLHENTRVLFLEAITDLEDLYGGSRRKIVVRKK